VFAVPRAETLAVTWYGSPEQALIYGWPADLGLFAGVGASRVGDSLVCAILFDAQLGVQVRAGVTARFVAGRARRAAREDVERMTGICFRLVITALGLWAAATVVPGVWIDGWGNLAVAALLPGIVN